MPSKRLAAKRKGSKIPRAAKRQAVGDEEEHELIKEEVSTDEQVLPDEKVSPKKTIEVDESASNETSKVDKLATNETDPVEKLPYFGRITIDRELYQSTRPVREPQVFDKQRWVDSLGPEERELLDLEIRTMDDSWFSVLSYLFLEPRFLNLKRFLRDEIANGETIFPPLEDVYSWTRYTPFDTVKVVIIGQDPYHNFNQAHGLAFSVKPPTLAPPSLRNVFASIQKDYPDFEKPKSQPGCLIKWARQGVLLLNSVLTVRAHQANSHARKGWEFLTEKVLYHVAHNGHGAFGLGDPAPVVFLAWGKPAELISTGINLDFRFHRVLQTSHPSPLSAHKGFLEAKHFKRTNDVIEDLYGPEAIIDWALEPGNKIAEIESKLHPKEKETEKE